MSDIRPQLTPVRDLRVAMAFLTRLPVGWIEGLEPGDLARAAWAFPLVGFAVSAVGGGTLYLSSMTDLHPLACALLGLAAQAIVTGALHEDGLADVADGIGGGNDRDRALEIMRDSRIGTFGVLALVFVVGLKIAFLAGMPGPGWAAMAMIGAAVLSRASLPMVMYVLPAARADGLSKEAGMPPLPGAVAALAIGVLSLFFFLQLSAGAGAMMLAALVVCAVAVWARRRLGGQTGDVLGAMQQLSELAVLFAAAAWSTFQI